MSKCSKLIEPLYWSNLLVNKVKIPNMEIRIILYYIILFQCVVHICLVSSLLLAKVDIKLLIFRC